MTAKYAKDYSTRKTPQSEPIPGKPMVPNSGGGYTFAVDNWARLERFLILGNEGGSYYATERQLTVENARCVEACLAEDAARAVRTIVEVSDQGRAPKNDPAVFALALAAGTGHAAQAMEALPKVCRTGHAPVRLRRGRPGFRGWGKTLKRGVADWYDGREARRTGLPGRQVPAAQRLVAPRPAPAGAPALGRRRAPGGLPLGRRRPRGAGRPRGQARRGRRRLRRRLGRAAGDPGRVRRRAGGGHGGRDRHADPRRTTCPASASRPST